MFEGIDATTPPLCGHAEAKQRIGDMSGRAWLCTPCFHAARGICDAYEAGMIGYRALLRQMTAIVGEKEARGFCRAERRTTLVSRWTRWLPKHHGEIV